MSENEPAQMIEGRYRIVRNIAEGGMATVYEAVDERLGRTVAIKVMHTQLAKGPHREQFVERFRREANSAASIANPHIVQVYDTGEFNGLDFLVMEYVHGVNLRHEMNTQGTFSVRETLRVVFDQVGTPTYAGDLALAIFSLIEAGRYTGNEGVYHFTDEGVCSWYDFAVEIAAAAGHGTCRIIPCHTSEYPTKAQRPAYSVLDKTRFKETFQMDIPHWREALIYCMKRLTENNP